MPAERSKATAKRSNEMQATQLVWAVDPPAPVEAPTDCNVSFTANMTSTTFDITSSHSSQGDDLPPLVDAPVISEFQFFTPDDGYPNPKSKRVPHSKKRPENHIPRPPNAFILFRSSFIKSQHVSAEVETNHSTLSKIIGMTWQSLPEEQRQAWHAKARLALQEHRKKFPKYSFRPAQNKVRYKGADSGGGNKQEGGKRKVREVEPKDLKRCAKIAELLVEGKKGAELDAAIQEFDRHHVPEIVTRFEAPITARAFRRSSSAPIPDTENSKKSQTFLPKSPVFHAKDGKRKLPRATSIQPTRCSTPNSDDAASELITATLKHEPSLDFSSFSFANVNQQPASTFDCDPCDPLSPILPPQPPAFLRFQDDCSAPAPLSIPNMPSFLMEDWSLSSSPISLSSSPISPYPQCDTFSTPSPMINHFDTHFGAFDNSTFEAALDLNLGSDKQYTLGDLNLSDSSNSPSYDPGAGVGINMLDMGMSMCMTDLVTGYDGTDYLNLLPQSACTQQQQHQDHFHQHQGPHQHHQMAFISSHHHHAQTTHQHHEYQQQQPHMPNLDLDLTALMAATHPPTPTEFVL
ncbi:hypothetical protein M378DRAFT_459398 [Amanita muscaria Koide BX008]|uniref:HMG box domain-containing protein n=1 Tax=Amanita muscaria (strain Koide BX008) TaxID=946122 RepID=A0A0C2WVE5_AMAMK|nr:hypothetical protein M378DRAFT_459398 [Amanita muscaria Koide BX008]